MALPNIDWKSLTDEELQTLALSVGGETNRRSQIAGLPDVIDSMIRDLKRYEGYGEGTVWVKPDSATRAYPKGWRTRHADKEWESTVSGNLEEPGTTGWSEVLPEWSSPAGPSAGYAVNEEVSHNDAAWSSTQDQNVDEPGVKGWNKKTTV